MSEELFRIDAGFWMSLRATDARFVIHLDDNETALTHDELKRLHEELGKVLWDVSAGRLKMEGE